MNQTQPKCESRRVIRKRGSAEVMIVGIGVDLIEVPRIAEALGNRRTGARFETRVFTPAEIA